MESSLTIASSGTVSNDDNALNANIGNMRTGRTWLASREIMPQ